jgi:hypothetical protein
VDDLHFRPRLKAPAYLQLQRSDALSYWNTRLVQRHAGGRYRSVTHEYLELAGEQQTYKACGTKTTLAVVVVCRSCLLPVIFEI